MAGVQIDGVNNKIDFDDDLDTSISANTDDTLVIEAGGNTMATITATTFTINDGTTITTDDNSDNLTLKSTDADSTSGPNLRLRRDSSSPADDDNLGNIFFSGDDSAGNETNYAAIKTVASDVTDGTEDGYFNISVANGGSLDLFLGITGPETVINDLSKDHDFRVESNGQANMLFVDGGNDRVHINGSTGTRELNVSGDNTRLLLYSTNNSTGAGQLQFGDADNEQIGRIMYEHDGNKMTFHTNAAERMRILSTGLVLIGATASIGAVHESGNDEQLGVANTGNDQTVYFNATNASYTTYVQRNDAVRAGSNAFGLFIASSGNESDNQYRLMGDGTTFQDGAASTSGADYAEYFEWKDGNSSSEDRRGYSVVLDGDKIVKATDSDDVSKIIGIISAFPAVVGDSASDKWQLKHLKDNFGSYVYEDYTQTEWTIVEEGKDNIFHSYQTDLIPDDVTVPDDAVVITKDADGNNLQRMKVNPDWNKDTTYIPRSDRKEWDTVGLMGKLRLKKGQPTGTNWIKMRDISDTVEEWLVR